ncbi:MAG: carboxypeptidase regulatory-like domain-containing protein [Verrucomicrobia bacterium]|nr:carboxypeptidase regulatory-like domain-containing protein [Verrucomicrobiota bacterium]
MKSSRALFCGSAAAVLALVAPVYAADIQGDVHGVDGRPSKAAEVRIERKDQKAPALSTTTNAAGRYVVKGVAPGLYNIAVKDGASASSLNVKTGTRNARIDFNLKPTAAKKIKEYVWMPPKTGTHMGGGWVEVNPSSPGATSNLDSVSGDALRSLTYRATNPGSGR